MNHLLDDALVALLLLVATAYAVASIGPKALRRKLLAGLAAAAELAPGALRLQRLAGRLRAASAKPAAACGGCDGCADDKPLAAEVRVPIGKIGRR